MASQHATGNRPASRLPRCNPLMGDPGEPGILRSGDRRRLDLVKLPAATGMGQGLAQAAAYNLTVVSGEKSKPQRVLGLDVGARRIGLAVTDPLGITAQGLETLERKNKKQDFAYLNRVLREYDVKEIVVGLPLRMSGEEGTQAEKIRIFAEQLG